MSVVFVELRFYSLKNHYKGDIGTEVTEILKLRRSTGEVVQDLLYNPGLTGKGKHVNLDRYPV